MANTDHEITKSLREFSQALEQDKPFSVTEVQRKPDGTTEHTKAQMTLRELKAALLAGRKCPRCGMTMIHSRLNGYVCPNCR